MVNVNFNKITTRQARALLRDPNNRNDGTFVGAIVAKNIIGKDYFVSIAKRMRTYFGKDSKVKYSKKSLINSATIRRYKENLGLSRILPSPIYDPIKLEKIDTGTKLGGGIPLSLFVSSPGTRATVNHLNNSERKQIAKQFYCHVPLIEGFRNSEKFKKHSLIVTEGLVKKQSGESLVAGDIRDLQTQGRAVVYEVLNSKGQNDAYATFELANYWKDNHLFQGLILHYDSLDPVVEDPISGRFDENVILEKDKIYHAEIIVVMPKVDNNYRGIYQRKVRTDINFRTFITDGLGYFQYK